MRNLPYVKFVVDDPTLGPAALKALADFEVADHERWDVQPNFGRFSEISAAMAGAGRTVFDIDYHTHPISIAAGQSVSGNALRLDNAVRDLWVAAELELRCASPKFPLVAGS